MGKGKWHAQRIINRVNVIESTEVQDEGTAVQKCAETRGTVNEQGRDRRYFRTGAVSELIFKVIENGSDDENQDW